jgi:spore maturation protein CgeB
VLNISRESMARNGYSPATRVFEAASAGACLITDEWEGIGQFFEPGREILVASDGSQVADLVRNLSEAEARSIGRNARERALADHTYARRAETVEQRLQAAFETPEVSLS